jgi:uncharacterized protein
VVRPGSGGSGAGRSISWDPAGGSIDATALEGVDAVIHLAGHSIGTKRWTDDEKRRIRDSRVDGTRLLAGALASLERKPGVLLSGSAVGYYGDAGDVEVDETGPAGEGFLAGVVEQWEEAASAAPEAGIRTAFLRTGVVLTSEGGALAKQLPIFRFGVGGRIGSGRQYLSWVSLEDEIGAIVHLLTAEVEGPVNLTAPNPVTNAEFTDVLGSVLHRPTVLPIPGFAPKVVLGGQLVDEVLLASQRVVPRKLLDSGYHFAHPHLEDALRAALEGPAAA